MECLTAVHEPKPGADGKLGQAYVVRLARRAVNGAANVSFEVSLFGERWERQPKPLPGIGSCMVGPFHLLCPVSLVRVELLLVSSFEKATMMSPIPDPLNESGPESNLCHVTMSTSIFPFARAYRPASMSA